MATAHKISYHSIGILSKLVTDYLMDAAAIRPFYQHPPTLEGVQKTIQQRQQFPINRDLLVERLTEHYQKIQLRPEVKANIEALRSPNTFTVCTAHQPNLWTGPMYFIFKILHAVKLAAFLNEQLPDYRFVPVYYMGSEDADLEELGHATIDGKKYEWQTKQQGAVGRMKVDKSLMILMEELSGQLGVLPHGNEALQLVKSCYKEGRSIADATFHLVDALMGEHGVVVLNADDAALKKVFLPIAHQDIDTQFSHQALTETISRFPSEYKVQASGRSVNLFYLTDEQRIRIDEVEGGWKVEEKVFTSEELKAELNAHPECCSPNVVLRPLLQEHLLPNVAFIGGGGELAYWMELKKIFEVGGVSYPVLVLRNSYLLMKESDKRFVEELGLEWKDLFGKKEELLKDWVREQEGEGVLLNDEIKQVRELYKAIKIKSGKLDRTLEAHVEALEAHAVKKLEALEKKLMAAGKRKHSEAVGKLERIKMTYFPGGVGLQERTENIFGFYGRYGKEILHTIYENAGALEQEFTLITL